MRLNGIGAPFSPGPLSRVPGALVIGVASLQHSRLREEGRTKTCKLAVANLLAAWL